MAGDAVGSTEEEQCATLLISRHRVLAPAREFVNRSIGESQSELELGDGLCQSCN
jgi:hypothetical protein